LAWAIASSLVCPSASTSGKSATSAIHTLAVFLLKLNIEYHPASFTDLIIPTKKADIP
jgi:hypothetical protein